MSFNKIAKYPSKEWAESMLTMEYSWREMRCECCNETFIHLPHGGENPICPYCGTYSSTYAYDYYEHLDRLEKARKIMLGIEIELKEKRKRIIEEDRQYEIRMRDGYPKSSSYDLKTGATGFTQYHKEGYNKW